MTLTEMKAAGERAEKIQRALECLEKAEHQLKLVNRYVKEHGNSQWSPELCLDRSNGYGRDVLIKVTIPFGFVQRQAINEVHDARRAVVLAGGDVPTATPQVQRGRS